MVKPPQSAQDTARTYADLIRSNPSADPYPLLLAMYELAAADAAKAAKDEWEDNVDADYQGDPLVAVEDHHERAGGGGYPRNRAEPGTMSQLLRLTDQFTAKHSARATRPALPAQVAARQLFIENPGDPLAALLIKEFGIYPPGSLVRLVSGELGIVVRRGRSANAPMVATLTTPQGRALAAPALRDTSRATFAIASSVPEPASRVRLAAQTFFPEAMAL